MAEEGIPTVWFTFGIGVTEGATHFPEQTSKVSFELQPERQLRGMSLRRWQDIDLKVRKLVMFAD